MFGENVPCYTFAEHSMCADESAAFEKMLQQRVGCDAFNLVEDNFLDLPLDAVVIVLYGV